MKHTYSLLTLGLLGWASASAQTLTNNGAQLTVSSGATLYISGGFDSKSGSTLLNNGTVQVTGDVTNAGAIDAAGTGTLSLTGTTNQVLNTGGASLYNLTLDKSTAGANEVTLPANLTVTNAVTLTNGIIRTAAGTTLILPEGAALNGEGAGRYVKGNLRTTRSGVNGSTALPFPGGLSINPGNNNMQTVTVTRTAGLNTVGSSYGVNPRNSNAKSIDRIWQIAATGTAPSANKPMTVTMSWVSDDDNGNTDLTLSRMWEAPATTGPWTPLGPATDASSRTLSGSADALGFFTVSNAANPLPVELLDFTAQRRNADAVLHWATAQEKDNNRFELEVSLDGRQFRRVATVAGQGTTTQRHDYEYTDPQIARYGVATLFYRLRQVDNSGEASFSPVRTVNVEGGNFVVHAWPNPIGADGLQVTVQTKAAGPVTLTLHDAVGRVLLSRRTEAAAGSTVITLPEATKWPVGVYVLTVTQGNEHAKVKVVRE